METRLKVYDAEEKGLYIGVFSQYLKLSDAKDAYRNSLDAVTEAKDNSIRIEIAEENASSVEGVIDIGVEEGEKFALALLNLCSAIKR
ncbi:hypothetical protein VBD025_03960 [Virgibacillus flavescens]|uniref:hypothetical protein n=1 Tax=Virgibacillus flavescens TaxID=1611422 RepID=UPI003D340452